MILGIVGVLLAIVFVGGLLGVVGLILGIVALGKARQLGGKRRGMATAGVVLNAVAILGAVVLVTAGIVFVKHHKNVFTQFQQCINQATTQQQQQQCSTQFGNRFFSP